MPFSLGFFSLPSLTPPPLCAGFGNHLARPLMRDRHRPDMSEEEATTLLRDCLRVGGVCVWGGWGGGGGPGEGVFGVGGLGRI